MKKILYVFVIAILVVLTSCTPAGKLEVAIAAASAECPMVIDEYTTCIDIVTEGKEVVYKYLLNESKAGFELPDMDSNEFRKIQKRIFLDELKSNAKKDETVAELVKLCKEANYNIVYRFIGSLTDYKYNITVYAYEL